MALSGGKHLLVMSAAGETAANFAVLHNAVSAP